MRLHFEKERVVPRVGGPGRQHRARHRQERRRRPWNLASPSPLSYRTCLSARPLSLLQSLSLW